MKTRFGRFVAAWGLFALVASAPAAFAQGAGNEERVQALIERLGDSEFSIREAASEALRKIGEPALEALKKAAASADPETAWRASQLVSDIQKGVGKRASEPESEKPAPERERGEPRVEPPRPAPAPQEEEEEEDWQEEEAPGAPFGGMPFERAFGEMEADPGKALESMGRLLEAFGAMGGDEETEKQMKTLGKLFKGLGGALGSDEEKQGEGLRSLLDLALDQGMDQMEDEESRQGLEAMKRTFDFLLRQGLEGLNEGSFPGDEEEEEAEESQPRLGERPLVPPPSPARPLASERAFGLAGTAVDPSLATQLGIPDDRGLLVTELEAASEAAKFGIERWDLVLAANGRAVHSVADLRAAVETIRPGEAFAIEILRKGVRRTLDARR